MLGVNDLLKVLDELYDIRAKWYDIGLRLNMPVETLEKIKAPDDNSCLRQVLIIWLRSGKATWLDLCQALRHRTLGQGRLADSLQAKYLTTEKSQTTEPQSGSSASKGNTSKKSSSTNPTQGHQTAYKSQEKSISASTKVGEAGTSKAKKRPSDASGPSATKKSKPSVKLPDSFTKDDFVREPAADRYCVKCSRVPFNPQRSVCCKRLYCEPCSKKGNRCRQHKADLQYTPDKDLYSKIQKLKIKCPHRTGGCNWKGIVLSLKNHLPTCGGHTKGKGVAASSHVSTEKDSKSHSKSTKSHPGVVMANQIQINIAQDTVGIAKPPGETSKTREEHESSTTPCTCTCSCPPLIMIMKPVSEYQTSTSKIWFSPTFRSHQLGYKLRLAVEVKPQPSHLQLNVAIVSAPPEDQPEFVKFPCVGYATVHILNPQHNKRHKDISFGFRISDESDKSMPAAVPNEYIMDDHLFFRVVKVELEEDYKPWLLDPHHEAEDSDSTDSEIESE